MQIDPNSALPHLFAVKLIACLSISLLILPPIQAQQNYEPNTLIQDGGVRGDQRYCYYSNGRVHTVDANDTCPLTMNYKTSGRVANIGFLQGESYQGPHKVCLYNVNGQERTYKIGVQGTSCPHTREF